MVLVLTGHDDLGVGCIDWLCRFGSNSPLASFQILCPRGRDIRLKSVREARKMWLCKNIYISPVQAVARLPGLGEGQQEMGVGAGAGGAMGREGGHMTHLLWSIGGQGFYCVTDSADQRISWFRLCTLRGHREDPCLVGPLEDVQGCSWGLESEGETFREAAMPRDYCRSLLMGKVEST